MTPRPRCAGCGRLLVWGTTPDGQRIPLDAVAPCYLVTGATPGGATVVRAAPPASAPAYVSHFVTCPERDRFRRRRAS